MQEMILKEVIKKKVMLHDNKGKGDGRTRRDD